MVYRSPSSAQTLRGKGFPREDRLNLKAYFRRKGSEKKDIGRSSVNPRAEVQKGAWCRGSLFGSRRRETRSRAAGGALWTAWPSSPPSSEGDRGPLTRDTHPSLRRQPDKGACGGLLQGLLASAQGIRPPAKPITPRSLGDSKSASGSGGVSLQGVHPARL